MLLFPSNNLTVSVSCLPYKSKLHGNLWRPCEVIWRLKYSTFNNSYLCSKPKILRINTHQLVSVSDQLNIGMLVLFFSVFTDIKWFALAKSLDTERLSSRVFFILWPGCVFYFHTFSPVPTISWRRQDGASFGRKVDINKASGVLEIPYFQLEDAGIYECVAENTRGRNSAKGKLSFYGE